MLEILVIEEIKRKEQEKEQESQIPLELPIHEWIEEEATPIPEPSDRGVIVIDLYPHS